jgi:DNA gyrase subunit A
LREGDSLLAVATGSTKELVAFFSTHGACYVTRIVDIPATTGYGEPVQKLFKFDDGEGVVGMMSLDPRTLPPADSEGKRLLMAVKADGMALRFPLEPHLEASTRSGRRYAKAGIGSEVMGVMPVNPKDVLIVATQQARVLLCKANEINELSGPGKGVTVIKVPEGDKVIGFSLARAKGDVLTLETTTGKTIEVGPGKYEVTARAGKGHQVSKRDEVKVVPPPVQLTELPEQGEA